MLLPPSKDQIQILFLSHDLNLDRSSKEAKDRAMLQLLGTETLWKKRLGCFTAEATQNRLALGKCKIRLDSLLESMTDQDAQGLETLRQCEEGLRNLLAENESTIALYTYALQCLVERKTEIEVDLYARE